MSTAANAFAKDDPPPPPPPPPIEETGPVDSPTSGEWQIKGQDSLLDKSTGHKRSPMLSFFVGPAFGTGYRGFYVTAFELGIGARFYIPIVAEGFLPMLNDSFGIEFGFDTFVVLGGFGSPVAFAFGIPVEARWNFHIFPKLEAYAKIGASLGLFPYSGGLYAYPILIAHVGALFKLSNAISLRAEVGSSAVKVGIGIAF